MPELGKYAVAVLGAYGVMIVLLSVLCALTFIRSRRIRRMLAAAEQRLKR